MKSTLDKPPALSSTGNGWKLATLVLAVLAIIDFSWALSLKSNTPMSGMSHDAMGMSSDLGPADAQYDKRFIDKMIPHHQSAVEMGNDASIQLIPSVSPQGVEHPNLACNRDH